MKMFSGLKETSPSSLFSHLKMCVEQWMQGSVAQIEREVNHCDEESDIFCAWGIEAVQTL